MANRKETKKALAKSLKGLMKEKSFEKISIKEICEKCGMNRKSFYYHFKDKYDLVNWIFDTEFMIIVNENTHNKSEDFFLDLCKYFYENKSFYRKAFKIKGQNGFSDHFKEEIIPIISQYLKEYFIDQSAIGFYVHFLTDAIICTIERWILSKECIPADELVRLMKSCIIGISQKVSLEMEDSIERV